MRSETRRQLDLFKWAFDSWQRGEARYIKVVQLWLKEAELCTECFHVHIQLCFQLLFALLRVAPLIKRSARLFEKRRRYLIPGNKNAAARSHDLASAHRTGRAGPRVQQQHQKRKLEVLCAVALFPELCLGVSWHRGLLGGWYSAF